MKKKIILTLVIIGLLTSSLYANFFDDDEFFDSGKTFKPISARMEAMGGAGLATSRNSDAFFYNPANLAGGKFSLNLPSVSVTLFNPKKIIDTGVIQKLMEGKEFDPTADILPILGTFNRKGDILTTDVATSFTVGGFGLGLNVQQQLHNVDTSLDANLFVELNVALSVGLGVRIPLLSDKISLDVGAVARPTYKVYTAGIGVETITNIALDDDDADDPFDAIMKEVALAAGSALPFDVGVNLNLPFGFRVSAVARDLNGKFEMEKYEHSGDYINEMMDLFGGDKNTYKDGDPSYKPTKFEVEVPWSLDFGVGWVGSFGRLDKFIRPTFSFDFVDVNNLAKALETDKNAYWNHLRAGVELRLLSTIDLRAGMNRGALSVGVGLDLFAMRVDAAYYWREMGVSIGDRSVDAFTIRFNLGYDR